MTQKNDIKNSKSLLFIRVKNFNVISDEEIKMFKDFLNEINPNLEKVNFLLIDDEININNIYEEKTREISILMIITECLGKDGLVNILLQENILPVLERNVNEILEYRFKLSNDNMNELRMMCKPID